VGPGSRGRAGRVGEDENEDENENENENDLRRNGVAAGPDLERFREGPREGTIMNNNMKTAVAVALLVCALGAVGFSFYRTYMVKPDVPTITAEQRERAMRAMEGFGGRPDGQGGQRGQRGQRGRRGQSEQGEQRGR
jgi:hypothetical protein